MTEHDEMKKKPLGLARPGKLELKKTVETGQVRQNFSHGRSKMVTVEVRKKRTYERGAGGKLHAVSAEDQAKAKALAEAESTLKAGLDAVAEPAAEKAPAKGKVRELTEEEMAARAKALEDARRYAAEHPKDEEEAPARPLGPQVVHHHVEEDEPEPAPEPEAAPAPEAPAAEEAPAPE
ncbi:MAG: IF-2-associated domain-containing protein, partial [Rhodobacterales bacterium]|nr:IF-2-associated domain-containing protein [Rhodobacterales bacterium]